MVATHVKGAAFAMVPFRAIGDPRLSGLHLKTLAAIAWHDRGSSPRGKGQGCWAGNKKLATEIGCNYANLSTAITELGRWGYVTREDHPMNKKLRIYRVTYDPLPTGKPSVHGETPANGLDTVPDPPQAQTIVCPQKWEGERSQELRAVEYIPLSGEETSLSEITNSPKGHASREVARNGSGVDGNVGAQLAIIERRMKDASWEPGDAEAFIDELNKIALHVEFKDPTYGWLERLLQTCEAVADDMNRAIAAVR